MRKDTRPSVSSVQPKTVCGPGNEARKKPRSGLATVGQTIPVLTSLWLYSRTQSFDVQVSTFDTIITGILSTTSAHACWTKSLARNLAAIIFHTNTHRHTDKERARVKAALFLNDFSSLVARWFSFVTSIYGYKAVLWILLQVTKAGGCQR